MAVTRDELQQLLSEKDPVALAAVLEAAEVPLGGATEAPDLAAKLVRSLWWRTHTPAGVFVMPDDLDALIDRVASKAGVAEQLGQGQTWDRLEALTATLVPQDRPLRLEELDPAVVRKLQSSQWVSWVGVGTAGTAAGGQALARLVLTLFKGPIGDILPFLPKIGPIAIGVKKAAQLIARISGPLGIGVALLTLNHAMGADLDKAAPLLVGVGLLMRSSPAEAAPVAVDAPEAAEVAEPEAVEPEIAEAPEPEAVEAEPALESEVLEPEVLDAEPTYEAAAEAERLDEPEQSSSEE